MDNRAEHRRQAFRVRVGHAEVIVEGETVADAIRAARKKLSHDMPRLWDVIHRLEDKQFRVDPQHH